MDTMPKSFSKYPSGFSSKKRAKILNLRDSGKLNFSLPIETKMSITKKMFDPNAQQNYRGYFPIEENYSSYKEGSLVFS